ncbi:ATP-binding cassette sub-family member [Salix suchowensis]|nr:ATP-binding cassette sub-family member [Salix suchowensis]
MNIFSKPLKPSIPLSRSSAFTLLAAFLVLRSRILTIPKDALARLKKVAGVNQNAAQELAEALRQVYTKEADGSKTLFVPYRNRVSKVNIRPTLPEKFESDAPYFPEVPPVSRTKPNVDTNFLRQLRAILFRIAFPKLRSKETFIVALHSFFLILRTVLSVGVARLDGMIVRDLVRADGKGFLKGLGLWFLLAIPSTYTNSMVSPASQLRILSDFLFKIRHLQAKLSLNLRTRLSRYINDLYLSSAPNLRYYRSDLDGIDQYVTADVDAWADALAGL